MSHELIKERAEVLHDILEQYIDNYEDHLSYNFLDAFKATFALKHRSISLYRRAFQQQGLAFDISAVNECFLQFAQYLPGPRGLMDEEKEILRYLKNNTSAGISICTDTNNNYNNYNRNLL